ncbi:ARM repeat-containing protein [Saitoella complicata NRRL Y-17804]|uniref:ARM repeat-containing protein n=1 Tax=Saitoella complicata (strain BCRC 22490 / CBS 7301 / JCM 7358 / NBRC 10748 / NRRL Y-17804) TaxID=698492 RepID=UPI0008670648|nr:ARM repeat-containing protein [Saitoella complicata NRRL Y-17804]ODQ53845.1 ARM repeat-containing protein [Saitoella complicata NRRL Y-17804]
MATVTSPTSVDQVKELIRQLYAPGQNPEWLKTAQRTLQGLQHSPDGWALAEQLLASEEDNVRFFGALTYQVKINADWKTLPEEYHTQLLTTLVSWLLRYQNGPSLVARKLVAVLTTFALHTIPTTWKSPVKYLAACLAAKSLVPTETAESLSMKDLVGGLNESELKVTLEFANVLAEEADKTDLVADRKIQVHQAIKDSMHDIVDLLGYCLSLRGSMREVSDSATTVVKAGLGCLQSWLLYSADMRSLFQSMVPDVFACLAHPVLFGAAAEFTAEVLSHSRSFFPRSSIQDLVQLVTGPWGQGKLRSQLTTAAQGDEEDDSSNFNQLLIALGETTSETIADQIMDPHMQVLLSMLLALLNYPGYAVADEEVSPLTQEFWCSVVESIAESETNLEAGNALTMGVVEAVWRKIRWPSVHIERQWARDVKDDFAGFRRDLGDLLEQCYPVLRLDLITRLMNLLEEQTGSPSNVSWEDVEATLFCFVSIADAVPENSEETDRILIRLFSGPLFALQPPDASLRLRHTILNMTGLPAYSVTYSSANESSSSLSMPTLSNSASKSILTLCSACRGHLTSELANFGKLYMSLSTSTDLGTLEKERVTGAIAAIIQALPREPQKLEPLSFLIEQISRDFELAQVAAEAGNFEHAKELALSGLWCLTAAGKALGAPEQPLVILSGETTTFDKSQSFWQKDGQILQSQILTCVSNVANMFRKDPEVMDGICQVIRIGFREQEPGPFVFPIVDVVDFLVREIEAQQQPMSACLLTTSSKFLASCNIVGTERVDSEVSRLLDTVLTCTSHALEATGLKENPDVLHGLFDLLAKYLPCYPKVLFAEARLPNFLRLAIIGLTLQERLAQQGACAFLSDLYARHFDDADLDRSASEITRAMGPEVMKQLLVAFGGAIQRTALPQVSEVFGNLLRRHPQDSKRWLTTLFAQPGFLSAQLQEATKATFLKQIVGLALGNKNRQVRDHVKALWLQSRGLENMSW